MIVSFGDPYGAVELKEIKKKTLVGIGTGVALIFTGARDRLPLAGVDLLLVIIILHSSNLKKIQAISTRSALFC